jgi:hypothetical protein
MGVVHGFAYSFNLLVPVEYAYDDSRVQNEDHNQGYKVEDGDVYDLIVVLVEYVDVPWWYVAYSLE